MMKCSKCGEENPTMTYGQDPPVHDPSRCRDILAERLAECHGNGLAGDPSKWSHASQIDGLRAQLATERAKREEAERERDELRACINNYDQMTRAAARQASDADARSSALLDALERRQTKGHADTCSYALDTLYQCDCGYHHAVDVLAAVSQSPTPTEKKT
jgi:chromosome segregation ATPase